MATLAPTPALSKSGSDKHLPGGKQAGAAEARPLPMSGVSVSHQREVLRGHPWFDTLDRYWLTNIRARVDAQPFLLLDELYQARIFLGLVLFIGFVLVFYYVTLMFHHTPADKVIPEGDVLILWMFICLFVIPFTLKRASSPRLHCTIFGIVVNIWPWIFAFEGHSFRMQCLSGTIGTPVVTIFLMGSYAGVLSGISCFGLVVFKYILELNGYVFPLQHIHDSPLFDKLYLINAGVNLFFVLLLGVTYEWLRISRTRALEAMNSNLESAIQETRAASELKTRFLANMSHEIRTPLNGIIGMTEILLQSTLSVTQRKELNIVYQCGNGLLAIVSDILDFSKIVANKVELEWVAFDIDRVVARCFDTLALRAYDKKIQLVHDMSGLETTRYMGDPTRIQQIVLNLLSNAVKFTPEQGEVTLRAWSTKTSSDKARLFCEVTDTGPGIPDKNIRELFEPFFQGDVATTRIHGGTGLGLAITRSLVTLMGGRISIGQRTGGGSVFAFDIDVGMVPPVSIRDFPPPKKRLSITTLPVSPGKDWVLLWDDCESHHAAMRAMIEAKRHKVELYDAATASTAATQARAMLVNMCTYQPDSDIEKEHFIESLIGKEIADSDHGRLRPMRLVLMNNPLGANTSHLDAYLSSATVLPRVRVLYVDRENDISGQAMETVLPDGRSLKKQDSGSGSRDGFHKIRRISPGTTAGVAAAEGGATSLESPRTVVTHPVAEIVFLSKPALPRHVELALTAPFESLLHLEPGLSVLDCSGMDVRSSSRSRSSTPDDPTAGAHEPPRQLHPMPPVQEEGSLDGSTGAGVSSHSSPAVGLGPSTPGATAPLVIPGHAAASVHTPTAAAIGLALGTPTGSASSLPGTPVGKAAERKPSLLLVEDNKVNISVAVKLLKLLGYAVDVAENGLEAVSYVERSLRAPPTIEEDGTIKRPIILMDLHMPVKGGMEAAAEIKRLCEFEGRPTPYIVAVTADALESTRTVCLSSSFDDFLSKPFHLTRLKEVLKRAKEIVDRDSPQAP